MQHTNRKPIFFILMSFLTCFSLLFGNNKTKTFETISSEAFAELIADTTIQVVDVRSEKEFAAGHIERAILINVQKEGFEEEALSKLDKGRPLAVYCRSGVRSAKASEILIRLGYEVYNLRGGYMNYPYKKSSPQ